MKERICVSRIGLTGALLMLVSGLTLAQDAAVGSVPSSSTAPAAPSSFGPYTAMYSIPADAFSVTDSSTSWSYDISTFARYRTGGSASWFNAPLSLPTGAHVDAIAFEVYDNDPAYEISTWLGVNVGSTAGTNTVFVTAANTAGTPGWEYVTSATLNITIDNFNNSYFLQASMSANGGQHKLRRALVYYHLQVSPDPPSATFGDVPVGHPQHQFVEALVAAGITAGCGGGNYCPSSPLTRGQMAVFLSKLVGLYWPN